MAGRPAKTPKGQQRRTVLRYARPTPLKTPCYPHFCKIWTLAFKWVGRVYRPDGSRGKPPKETAAWARLFAHWGGKIYSAPPDCLNFLGKMFDSLKYKSLPPRCARWSTLHGVRVNPQNSEKIVR
jgi:hypothetical protein